MASISHKKVMALLISVFVLIVLFRVTAYSGNVYKYAVTGAIYELVALPSVAIGLAVPIFSLIYWYKQKWSIRSPFLYIAVFSILSYAYLISRVN